MNTQQFKQHFLDKNIIFTEKERKKILIEEAYFDEYGVYNIFERVTYLKTNGKSFYVDTFLKKVNVSREKLTYSKNEYSFSVKNKYVQDVLNEALS